MKTLKLILTLFAAAAVCGCRGRHTPEPEPVGDFDKVLIVYMEGYNNLSGYMLDNLEQICSDKLPKLSDRKALVVYSHNIVKRLDYRTHTEPVLMRFYQKNGTVQRDTLLRYNGDNPTIDVTHMRKVLSDVYELFPSQSYGLLFSSHASGWIPDSYDGEEDIFWNSLSERRTVGAEFYGSSGNSIEYDIEEFRDAIPFHLEYIAFDACLMGGAESCYTLRNVCDYIVASPAEVLASGFNYYKLVSRLLCDGASDLVGLCEDYYEMSRGSSMTIGLYDCSKIQKLVNALKPFYQSRPSQILNLDSRKVQAYNYSFNYHYDLKDIIVNMGASPAEIAALDEALKEFVIHKRATDYCIVASNKIDQEKYSGLSMYLPKKSYPKLNSLYEETEWNKAVGVLQPGWNK